MTPRLIMPIRRLAQGRYHQEVAGIVFIGGTTSGPPSTWGGSGVTGQSALESKYTSGNTNGVSGATITGVSGAVTASATGGGGGNGWGFPGTKSQMVMATFPAAGGGGGGFVPHNPWPQIGPLIAQ